MQSERRTSCPAANVCIAQTRAHSILCGLEQSLRHVQRHKADARSCSSAELRSFAGTEAALTTVDQGTPMSSRLLAPVTMMQDVHSWYWNVESGSTMCVQCVGGNSC